MFGHKSKLTLDLQFRLQTERQYTKFHHKVMVKLEDNIQWAHNLAQKTQKWEMRRHKKRHEQNAKCIKLEPRYLMLFWQKGFKGKHKIANESENVNYEIVEKCDNVPIYKIKPCLWQDQDPDKLHSLRNHAIHMNILFPVSLSLNDTEEDYNDHSDFPVSYPPVVEGSGWMKPMKIIVYNLKDMAVRMSQSVLGWWR